MSTIPKANWLRFLSVVLTLTLAGFSALTLIPAGHLAAKEVDRNLTVMPSAVTAPVRSPQRHALVIGNSAYSDAPLSNPVNDAREISRALKESGFSVTVLENTDFKTMLGAIRAFGDQLKKGGVGLFYYAGHGMQIRGRNYLIPVGSNIEREDEVAYSAVDAQAVLDKMDAASNGTNIMILDACRNNPFIRSTRNGQQGLAQMDAPVGTLVAFATSPGAVASDGAGQNGLYTLHLLQAIRQPGAKLEDVFKQVRSAVRRDSKGKQVPWEVTSLEGDFYFNPPVVAAVPPIKANPVASNADSPKELENAMWAVVKDSDLVLDLKAFLLRFPVGMYAAQAKNRIKDLESIAGMSAPRPSEGAALPSAPKQTSQSTTNTGLMPGAGGIPAPTLTPPTNTNLPPPNQPISSIAALSTIKARNPFGFTVGDRWSMQVIDKYKKEVISNFSLKVTKVLPSGDLQINGSEQSTFSPEGNWRQFKGQGIKYRAFTPSQRLFPSTMEIGFAEDFKYLDKEEKLDGSTLLKDWTTKVKVVGREKVRVPAGEFDTYRIERTAFRTGSSDFSPGGITCFNNMVIWYAPSIRYYVALNEEARCGSGTGDRTRIELTSFEVSTPAQIGSR